jgi:hypothetical protein
LFYHPDPHLLHSRLEQQLEGSEEDIQEAQEALEEMVEQEEEEQVGGGGG